jgi:hypothetical protein
MSGYSDRDIYTVADGKISITSKQLSKHTRPFCD